MQIELNLWFSLKTGQTFGNLNINQKEDVQNIDKLLPIQTFCEQIIKKKILTEDDLALFIELENFDEEAKYAFTKQGSIVWWNNKKDHAFIIYNGTEIKLPFGVKRRAYKGMPDVYFRQL